MEAITGRRVFYAGEYRRMIVAENITIAFHERAIAKDWATWQRENKELANLLFEAEQLANADS